MINLLPTLGGVKSVALVKEMLNIPENPVWIHENTLCNLIGIKGGPTYGKKDVMTYLLEGIEKGGFGNRKKK